MTVICAICGISAGHRSYIATHKLHQNIRKKISWVLTPKIDIYFCERNSVCAICLQKVDNVIRTLRDMRKQSLLTIVLLKKYYENSTDTTSWFEFQQSHSTDSLSKEEDIKPILEDLDCVISDNVNEVEIEIDNEKNCLDINEKVEIDCVPLKSEDDCIDEEWLSDLEIEFLDQAQINTKFLQKALETSEVKAPEEDESINVKDRRQIRVTKRGYIYMTKSQELVTVRENGVFACLLCNKSFKYRYKAELHVRSDHTQEKPFKCNECTKSFAASHYLRRHISSVHEKKKFICQKCERAFSRRYELTTHEKSHNEQPHLPCLHNGCDKKFYASFLMRKHYLNSHAVKLFICDECGKSFRKKDRLTKHLKCHKRNTIPPMK